MTRQHTLLRTSLAQALDPQLRQEKGLSLVNQILIAVISLSILSGILETENALRLAHLTFFKVVHAIFFFVFLLEYIGRLYVATVNPRYPTTFRYAITLSSVFDLIVLISFALPFFGFELSLFRMFRAARLIRLARLGKYSVAMQSIYDAVASRRYELTVSMIIAAGLMLISATALYLFEGQVQPVAFGSIPRALWWAIVTLTTVGYGDVIPMTVAGRIAAAATALTGIGIIAIPTGILAGAFSDALRTARSDLDKE